VYSLDIRTSHALVERDEHLRALTEVFAVPSSSGKVVLLSGEAGFGKTSLLQAGLDTLDHKWRVLLAISEPLDVPAAFAPLYDLMAEMAPELQDDIRSGTGRMPVYSGMLDLVKNDRVVLVLEDVHWADEATLGLVRYLGKRMGATQSVLIVTFRSEEVNVNPPLRLVVADLGPSATRIELPALTVSGVEELARGTGLDPGHVHETTLGNPFFVEEVLMHPDIALPPTIQYAVLANAAQLPDDALEFVNTVALSPDGVPLADIAQLGDPTGIHCDLAFSRRLVSSARGQVSCRHELIRQSLVEALPPATRRRLHERLLAHLERTAPDSRDTARLAYNAIGAGDAEKSAEYSLMAAEHAAAGGAHRQAAFSTTHCSPRLVNTTSSTPSRPRSTSVAADSSSPRRLSKKPAPGRGSPTSNTDSTICTLPPRRPRRPWRFSGAAQTSPRSTRGHWGSKPVSPSLEAMCARGSPSPRKHCLWPGRAARPKWRSPR
jgi:hypothetical protein